VASIPSISGVASSLFKVPSRRCLEKFVSYLKNAVDSDSPCLPLTNSSTQSVLESLNPIPTGPLHHLVNTASFDALPESHLAPTKMVASSDANGTQVAAIPSNGSSNGGVTASGVLDGAHIQLSTLPGPNHDWKISLKEKVIASMI
jgi:hypothetical protein